MKARMSALARAARPSPVLLRRQAPGFVRNIAGLSQKPNTNYISFPGALKSEFTNTLKVERPEEYPALPTYRVVDQNGTVIDESFELDLSDEEVVKLYKDMVFISILDNVMQDVQRQGRISFYMMSTGEEAITVGSASAFTMDDVIFLQYREQGTLRQRGYTVKEFMAQLFANKYDPGRGRNMPVHYGSSRLNIVSHFWRHQVIPLL
jgi:2-oxoisovalerate dehydrogenase E1 component alpha subunit